MDFPATPFNEELIVRYLLGELAETEQVEVEDQAFRDERYMQTVLAVESDLIDEYVRGEFPADRLQQFEKHFLASAERRDKVEFARALATVSAEQEATQPAPVANVRLVAPRENPFLAFLRSLQPAAAFSLAAAALILIFGLGWLVRDGLKLRVQLAQLQAEQREREARQHQLEEQILSERKRNDEIAAQLQQGAKEGPTPQLPRQQPSPETAAPPATVVALVLLPGLSRGSGTVPALTVAPTVGTVRLLVGIDPQDDYPRFTVEVRNPSNKIIGTQSNLKPRTTRAGRSVFFDLPASKLTPGRHELALKGVRDGATEDLGYYYFDIQKK